MVGSRATSGVEVQLDLAGPRVRSGLEQLLARPSAVRGLRVGLIANPTSVTSDLLHASLALKAGR